MKYIIITLSIIVPLTLIFLFVRWVLKSSDKILAGLGKWGNSAAGYIIFGCLLIVFGAAFLVVVVNKQMEYRDFKKYGVSAQGVISHIKSRREGENTTHDVYVKFTAEGKEYTFKSHYYSSRMGTGDILPVLYYPDNPDKAMVAKHTGGVIFYVLAIILVFSGIVLLRKYKMYVT